MVPTLGTGLLRPREFSKWGEHSGVCGYVNEVMFAESLEIRVGCQGNRWCLEGWNLSRPHRFLSWEGDSVPKGQCFSQSCLCNEAPIKPQQDGIQRDSGLVRGRGSSPRPCPVLLFHLAVPEFRPCAVSWRSGECTACLSSGSCSSKGIQPQEGSLESSIYRSTGDHPDLTLTSAVGEGQSCSTEPLNQWGLRLNPGR